MSDVKQHMLTTIAEQLAAQRAERNRIDTLIAAAKRRQRPREVANLSEQRAAVVGKIIGLERHERSLRLA